MRGDLDCYQRDSSFLLTLLAEEVILSFPFLFSSKTDMCMVFACSGCCGHALVIITPKIFLKVCVYFGTLIFTGTHKD